MNIGNVVWKTNSGSASTACRVIESFGFKNDLLGDLFLKRRLSPENGFGWQKFSVFNRVGKELGYEVLRLCPQEKYITGADIYVIDEYRKKFHLGEVLRLSSIMELLENGLEAIKIKSKNTAVYFHAKYGFKPDFIDFYTRDKLLSDILKDSAFPDFSARAAGLLRKISNSAPEGQRDACREANKLVKDYIERALCAPHPEKSHPFSFSTDMILTRENVLENRDFFNRCFAKHSIDYKID